jgi:hypothetical protein
MNFPSSRAYAPTFPARAHESQSARQVIVTTPANSAQANLHARAQHWRDPKLYRVTIRANYG